jgi:ethanolamine ammonia-lyase large subunit
MLDNKPSLYVNYETNETHMINLTTTLESFQDIVDFDVLNDTIYILDALGGVAELNMVSRGVLSSTMLYNLTDILENLGMIVFTDTMYNGIAVTGDQRLFISTNNA